MFGKFKVHIFTNKSKQKNAMILSLILFLLIIGNLAIYGYNLIVYKAILPPCEAILSKEQCELNPFYQRLKNHGLEEKLTIVESIIQGYPGPIKFFITMWIPNMISRIFGADGHVIIYTLYGPTFLHILLFIWTIFSAFIYKIKLTFRDVSLLSIILIYSLILFIKQYDTGLSYGFKDVILHGRYIFPVIGLAYIYFIKIIMVAHPKKIRVTILIFTVQLYFLGGPIFFIPYLLSISDWFIR